MTRSGDGLTVGVDLGGTKIATSLVDANGKIVASNRRDTAAARGADRIIEDITAGLRECIAGESPPNAVGVGIAGQVDPGNGTVLHAPNLDWTNVPLRDRLADAAGLPVFVLNDVQAATFGEWKHGAGQGVSNLVTVFVGTGVGGGVVTEGALTRGCSGSAGELGHLKIEMKGRSCTCGRVGCVEAYAGGWAIGQRARELVATHPERATHLITLAGSDPITGRTVAEAFHAGDALAVELVHEVARALGVAVASVVNAFNPCLIVLGGGVIEGLPELVGLIEREVQRSALPAALAGLRMTMAALGRHAGAVGAAAWARCELATQSGVR